MMATDKKNKQHENPHVDEDYLMQVISGEEPAVLKATDQKKEPPIQQSKEKSKISSNKKATYEDTFLINRFPSGRNGKVVYIRPEYHERLLRIVQLSREDRTTLYSYIDKILEQHFLDYGNDITDYFNQHFKPIL